MTLSASLFGLLENIKCSTVCKSRTVRGFSCCFELLIAFDAHLELRNQLWMSGVSSASPGLSGRRVWPLCFRERQLPPPVPSQLSATRLTNGWCLDLSPPPLTLIQWSWPLSVLLPGVNPFPWVLDPIPSCPGTPPFPNCALCDRTFFSGSFPSATNHVQASLILKKIK